MIISGTALTTRNQKVFFACLFFNLMVHCTFWSHLDQGFGDRQTERCCLGLLGGLHQKTIKGNLIMERLRTVLMFISMKALSLASGGMPPALLQFTMFVKEVSE